MVLLFRERDEKHSYADRRELFSIFETLCDPHFAQLRVVGGQNLIKSEERCADVSRLQPRVAERGTSILLMARPCLWRARSGQRLRLQPITSH
jgi:hypothetical protein